MPALDPERVAVLREEHYNATLVEIRRIHEDLAVFRIRPDGGRISYEAGQHTLLGLGGWEPRVEGTQEEALSEKTREKLWRRAYSFCSPILDEDGRLVPPGTEDLPEFYVSLVRRGPTPPVLTPRLFALAEGDRLFLDPEPHGRFTLEGIGDESDVIFACTGTGEAPFNAMVTELIARGHQGRLIVVNCVRYRRDLGYLEQHRSLGRLHPDYRYLFLTTREPENLDRNHPGYVGKIYLQEYLESGRLEAALGRSLEPSTCHVFLCGNPDMIGAPRNTRDPDLRYPPSKGMVEILERRGFTIHHPNHPGNLHFERYW